MSRVNNIYNKENNDIKDKRDYEKSLEKSLRDEGDMLVNKTLANLKDFKIKSYNLNSIINTSILKTEDLNEKFNKSTLGIKNNMNYFIKTISKKQGKVCWFIVLLFVFIYLIQRYYKLSNNNDLKSGIVSNQ